MKRLIAHIISTIALLICISPLQAEDLNTHSVYKVTTYNLGALLGEQESADLSLRSYEPLLITGTKSDILSESPVQSAIPGLTPTSNASKGFAIAAEYSATPQLAVQGVFGMTSNSWNPESLDSNSSWEANLGVVYKFLDNLSYQIHFGYMETGDLFSERNSYNDAESIIMVSNKLTLSF